MTKRQKICKDPEYIGIRRFNFRMSNLLKRYPEECPDHVIAAALDIPVEEVQKEYDRIVLKMRSYMGVKTEVATQTQPLQ